MIKPLTMKAFLLTFSFSLSALFNSCDSGIETIDDVKPGRRDYTWCVDTIPTPETRLSSIDGTEPDDVWATSSSGDSKYSIFHFDGRRWISDGIMRPLEPHEIRVFSRTDALIVGLQGAIWRWDGVLWKLYTTITVPGSSIVSLEDIHGEGASSLYTVGTYEDSSYQLHSLIYHFDGAGWKRINVPDVFSVLYKIRVYASGKALILGLKHEPDGSAPDSSKIFEFDGNTLKEIYSAFGDRDGWADIATVPGEILISKEGNMFLRKGLKENLLIPLRGTSYNGGMEARSEKDVFLRMKDGIAHFNGSDVQYLYNFSDLNQDVRGFKIFDQSIFVLIHNWSTRRSFVLRGYLK